MNTKVKAAITVVLFLSILFSWSFESFITIQHLYIMLVLSILIDILAIFGMIMIFPAAANSSAKRIIALTIAIVCSCLLVVRIIGNTIGLIEKPQWFSHTSGVCHAYGGKPFGNSLFRSPTIWVDGNKYTITEEALKKLSFAFASTAIYPVSATCDNNIDFLYLPAANIVIDIREGTNYK